MNVLLDRCGAYHNYLVTELHIRGALLLLVINCYHTQLAWNRKSAAHQQISSIKVVHV